MATVRPSIPAEVPGAAPAPEGKTRLPVHDVDQKSMDQRLEAMLKLVHANRPTEDLSLIRKAWEFSVSTIAGRCAPRASLTLFIRSKWPRCWRR
jgi:hypothetical protein